MYMLIFIVCHTISNPVPHSEQNLEVALLTCPQVIHFCLVFTVTGCLTILPRSVIGHRLRPFIKVG